MPGFCKIYLHGAGVIMTKGENKLKEINNECTEEHQVSQRDIYKKKIVEIVAAIENVNMLKRIYQLAEYIHIHKIE